MFPIRPGVSKKLLGLALFNAAAFALLAGIAAVAFNRVENLSSDIARTEITGVLENASIARELSTAFSEIDLISRSCRSGSQTEELGKRISATLVEIAKKDWDKEQVRAITALSISATQLLDQCVAIRQALVSVDRIDQQILAELANMENLIGRALIQQTLSGKRTDYLDQIMTLISGFRETMLQIGKKIAERGAGVSSGPQNSNPTVALIDDLNLRLQTLTASSLEIARIAKRVIRLFRTYRGQVLQLDNATNRFNDAVSQSHAAKTSVLKTMNRLDEQAFGRVEDLGQQLRQVGTVASRWVFWLSVLIVLLSFLAIMAIVRRSINRPLNKVLQHIEAIRNGEVTPEIPPSRGDEWGTIHSALLEMTTELARSRNLLQSVIDTAPVRVFWKDHDSRFLGCNPAFATAAGKTHPRELIGKDDYQMAWAAQADHYRADDRAVMTSGIPKLFFEERQTTPDGQEIWLRTSKVPLKNGHSQTIGVLGIYEDITERKQNEEKLQLAASVFSHSHEGIVITATDGTIIDVNEAFTRITGYGRDEVLGCNPRILKSGHHTTEFYIALWRDLLANGYWSGEIWNRRKSGEVYAEMLTISAVPDVQGNTQQYVALFSDITQHKEHERKLERMAHYDVLTSLPNRVLLADRLQQGMIQTLRRNQHLAVCYLDLDGFKAVNDNFGHEMGDQLLITLASRMKQALRESDTLGRIGGDEFVAVLHDLTDNDSSLPTLDRLLSSAAQPVSVGGIVLEVSASLGVTFYPQSDAVGADQLLRQADQAMYQAKVAGKNRYHIFEAEKERDL